MYRQVCLWTFLISAVAFAGCCPEGAAVRNDGTPSTDTVRDPGAWVKARDEYMFGHPGAQEQFLQDIDHDGCPELLISSTGGAGTAGRPTHIFQGSNDRYAYLGSVCNGVRALPPAEDGAPRFVSYHHLSSSTGQIIWWTVRDGRMVELCTETVCAGDGGTEEDRGRFRAVFGGE